MRNLIFREMVYNVTLRNNEGATEGGERLDDRPVS